MSRYLVGLDATPITTRHSFRGIGRYVAGVVGALVGEQPAWARRHLGLLVAGYDVAACRAVSTCWRTARTPLRPQDIGWLVAAAADRFAARSPLPDLWHQTDPSLPIGPLAPSRTLMAAYDVIPLLDSEVMRGIRAHRRLLYRQYLQRLPAARAVVAISERTARDLVAQLGVASSRIEVVYPPVQALAVRHPDGRQLGQPDGLLFVGVPEPHKRPELAIQALAAARRLLPDLTLDFVGHHPPAIRAHLKDVTAAYDLRGSVRFRDQIGDHELAELYRSRILLAVSRIEGFGLPPVESLLTGGRVVAVPVDVYHEVLGDAATFATSDEPAAVAAAIRDALSGPPAETAVTRLRKRYAPATVAARLVEVYERAVQ
jgi:glycosyltransferase involved in cell wall biosynthesis